MADVTPLEVPINEVEFKRSLRSLGISCLEDWRQWCGENERIRATHHFPIDPASAYNNPLIWRDFEAKHPKHWDRYQVLQRCSESDNLDGNDFTKFAARYRIADGFSLLRFRGIPQWTANVYSAGFRIFLSYSALEACCKATGKAHANICIFDPLLANELRSITQKAFSMMQCEIRNGQIKKVFTRFCADLSNDIMIFARTVWHLVTYGAFTALDLRNYSLKAANVYGKLSEVILAHSDVLLEHHCFAFSHMKKNGGSAQKRK